MTTKQSDVPIIGRKVPTSGIFQIYAVTNKITGQKYIGQTRMGIETRWQQHVNSGGGQPLAKAIKLFGPNNFVVFEIDRATTQIEANRKERALIRAAKSLFPNGYNAVIQGNRSYEFSKYLTFQQLWDDLSEEEKKELGLTSPPRKRWFFA